MGKKRKKKLVWSVVAVGVVAYGVLIALLDRSSLAETLALLRA